MASAARQHQHFPGVTGQSSRVAHVTGVTTMAILTLQESVDLLKATANNVMADGSVSMYPLHARAILDVLAAFEDAQKQLDAVPVASISVIANAMYLLCGGDLQDAPDAKLGNILTWLDQVQP